MQKSTEELTRGSTGTLADEENGENIVNKTTIRAISEEIMNVCKKLMHWVVFLDLFLLMTMIVTIIVLEFGGISYKQLGFLCNDPHISFKYSGDTITMTVLFVISLLVPLIMMWIVEHTCHSANSYNDKLSYNGIKTKYIWTWYHHYFVLFVMLCVICECMKIVINEPRPHFLDTCKPREAINCTDDEYIMTYTCTNDVNSWLTSDSSRSFPSGHAAISIYMCIFLVWYLQIRLSTKMLYLKSWLQSLVCIWAVMCCATRISDHRHHWWDVAAGIVLGIIFGTFLVTIVCRYFRINCADDVAVRKQTIEDAVIENKQINFVEE